MRYALALILLAAAVPESVLAQGALGRPGAPGGGFRGGTIGGYRGGAATARGQLGGSFRNSPSFRPTPSLTPLQSFRPAPSLSAEQNFNPKPSLYRPVTGSPGPAAPPITSARPIVSLPGRLRGARSRFALAGGTPELVEPDRPTIRLGTLAQPEELPNVTALVAAVRERLAKAEPFTTDWFRVHPDTWKLPGKPERGWATPNWLAVKYWLRIETNGYGYFYGNNVVQQGGEVRVAGRRVASAQEFRDKAQQLAQQGQKPAKDGAVWMPLGVFAVAAAADAESVRQIIQLSVDMNGVLRGTAWNVDRNAATKIKGRVDPKSQCAVWQTSDQQDTFVEAGVYNLTADAVPTLVHGPEKQDRCELLIRLHQPVN